MIENQGMYLSQANELWYYYTKKNYDYISSVSLHRISDKHVELFFKNGQNIDPT